MIVVLFTMNVSFLHVTDKDDLLGSPKYLSSSSLSNAPCNYPMK